MVAALSVAASWMILLETAAAPGVKLGSLVLFMGVIASVATRPDL